MSMSALSKASTLQSTVLELEQAQQAAPSDATATARIAEARRERDAALARLAELEQQTSLHRGLLEEEERAMYDEHIGELEELFAWLQAVRDAQGFRLTPWVRCTHVLLLA
jgi:hypothetical protein